MPKLGAKEKFLVGVGIMEKVVMFVICLLLGMSYI